ncbi:transcriptional regulator, IclR family [Streptosporangium subroseum]|uniref:Transcriptional regulator, IclR family n=1 Tax=Streptosporangium subroseum TaxID=106412 RepID=A0A239KH23_9ACTN|nr:IclR family transcriptional regulator [Streptosporangium subroseum]SNT16988.1 transcriptional regulator, IclR family [Streptosporangium subroseum]
MQNQPMYPLKAVENALVAIKFLQERGEVRVADVADHLAVARSTAHRVLAMLVFHDFAIQDARRIYRPGPALRSIRETEVSRPDLVTAAHPHLRELGRLIAETVHLMVLQGNGVRFVDGVEGPQALHVGSRIGMLLPAHATSGGKALLAELPEEELRALYPRGVSTEASAIGDLAALRRELDGVRRRGYAVNSEESERGVRAVGVCVRDGAGRAVAAAAIAVPSVRWPKRRLTELAVPLVASATRISAALAG